MSRSLVRNLLQPLFPAFGQAYELRGHYEPNTWQDIAYLSRYRTPAVQNAITDCKYHRTPAASRALGELLSTYCERFDPENISIVPVPQSYRRWRERGFDHLTEILLTQPKLATQRQPVLKKQRHTTRQAHVSKAIRLEQQANTFTCHAHPTLKPVVILFDDVTTTGATMRAARAALAPHLPAGSRLICLAIAH